MHFSIFVSATSLLAGLSAAQNSDWGQCGGSSWTGSTECGAGSGCVSVNEYYSQCQPGAVNAGSPTTLQTAARSSTAGSPTSTSGGSATGPGTTLQSGYYWIRAVEAPNFHKYLQSKTIYTPGVAVLGDYTTAGQFQVQDGQLVQLISAPGSAAQYLYGNVSTERVHNNQSLALSWSATKNAYGTFGWQGDGLTWEVADIKRPNSIAWLICEDKDVFINLGNYDYQTPSGCADETIHYYNDAHAVN